MDFKHLLFYLCASRLDELHADFQVLNATIERMVNTLTRPSWWDSWGISSIFGTVVGVFLGFFLEMLRTWWREKKEKEEDNKRRCSEINNALSMLESVRIEILGFKGQILNQYTKDAQEIDKKRKKSTEDDLIEFCKTQGKICTFFENFSLVAIVLNEFPYRKELSFLRLNRSPYLIVFDRLLEETKQINYQIQLRNDFVKFLKISDFNNGEFFSTSNIEKVRLLLGQHLSSAKNLDILVKSALAYIVLCKKYLNEYASHFLSGESILDFSLRTNYEAEMPPLDYHKDFDTMIQKAIKPSI